METLRNFIVFIGIFLFVAWATRMLGLSEFAQGSLAAAVAIILSDVISPINV